MQLPNFTSAGHDRLAAFTSDSATRRYRHTASLFLHRHLEDPVNTTTRCPVARYEAWAWVNWMSCMVTDTVGPEVGSTMPKVPSLADLVVEYAPAVTKG